MIQFERVCVFVCVLRLLSFPNIPKGEKETKPAFKIPEPRCFLSVSLLSVFPHVCHAGFGP